MVKMAHFFRQHDREIKERRNRRAAYYEPILDRLGAEQKRPGAWQYGAWNCYPRRGYASAVKDPNQRLPLYKVLGVQREPEHTESNY